VLDALNLNSRPELVVSRLHPSRPRSKVAVAPVPDASVRSTTIPLTVAHNTKFIPPPPHPSSMRIDFSHYFRIGSSGVDLLVCVIYCNYTLLIRIIT